MRYWLLLRERLGLDKMGASAANGVGAAVKGRQHGQDITKSEKEMCNMMAKASTDGGAKAAAPATPPSTRCALKARGKRERRPMNGMASASQRRSETRTGRGRVPAVVHVGSRARGGHQVPELPAGAAWPQARPVAAVADAGRPAAVTQRRTSVRPRPPPRPAVALP